MTSLKVLLAMTIASSIMAIEGEKNSPFDTLIQHYNEGARPQLPILTTGIRHGECFMAESKRLAMPAALAVKKTEHNTLLFGVREEYEATIPFLPSRSMGNFRGKSFREMTSGAYPLYPLEQRPDTIAVLPSFLPSGERTLGGFLKTGNIASEHFVFLSMQKEGKHQMMCYFSISLPEGKKL